MYKHLLCISLTTSRADNFCYDCSLKIVAVEENRPPICFFFVSSFLGCFFVDCRELLLFVYENFIESLLKLVTHVRWNCAYAGGVFFRSL